jgi:tetratricopeptide (TPR) repeat protein
MLRKIKIMFFVILASVGFQSCAFFNTFYHARKAYNNGIDVIVRNKEQMQTAVSMDDVPLDRFSQDLVIIPQDAKTFFDAAIEKANKVVVLYPKSGWAEDATLLLGKAHYLRGYTNDWYDAKNRLEVFLTRYPNSNKIAEAKLWYGKTLLKLDQIDDAEIYFRQVAESENNQRIKTEALIELGDIVIEENDYLSASGYYAKAVETAVDKASRKSALYKSFYAYYRMNDFKKAIGNLNILIRMDLDRFEKFDVLFMKARSLKLAGQYKESVQILDELIGDFRYKSLFLKAEFEIADALRLGGRNEEAVKQFNYVIDTYSNAVFTGDCYYFLGLIYDYPVLMQNSFFKPDPELAKKYYYLVKTRYTNSTYYTAASERLEYLNKMDLFRGTIGADEIFLEVIGEKIHDSNFVVNIEHYYPSTIDTVLQSEDKISDDKNRALIIDDKSKANAKKEVEAVKISNPDLDDKIQKIQLELLDIAQVKDPDTLRILQNKTLDRLANDYVVLADYFYFNLSDYDSADYYYQYVADRFESSPKLEFALYGHARVQQKKNQPNYKSLYQYAYNVFPDGRLSDIGRRVLNLKENLSDSAKIYFQLAEESFLYNKNFDQALQYYTQVAIRDTADNKLQALYAMGLLYEKKMDRPADAFRTYNTLVFANPNSDFAKKVKPKVEAYAAENHITKDSLVYWINRDFVKVTLIMANQDTMQTKDVPEVPVVDSARSRIPQEYKPLERELAPSDSTGIIKGKTKRAIKPSKKQNAEINKKEKDDLVKDE